MASITDLPGSAQVLLDAFVAQLTEQGVTLPLDPYGDPVAYLAPGVAALFAWDQPCLALAFDAAMQGTPGVGTPGNVNAWALTFSATFSLVLLRDVSGLNDQTTLPTPAAMSADAAVTMTDAVALLNAAVAIKENPPDWDGRQVPLVIGSVSSVGPEGGLGGNALSITVPLT